MRNRARRAVEQQAFRRIDEIVIGGRHRREMDDIVVLAVSIRDDTQPQQIVIRSAGTLISCARRSQAGKLLGLTKVSATINDRVDPTLGRRLTPSRKITGTAATPANGATSRSMATASLELSLCAL
jgi:hypothetical protein